MKKRVFAAFVCVAMVLLLLPGAAHAVSLDRTLLSVSDPTYHADGSIKSLAIRYTYPNNEATSAKCNVVLDHNIGHGGTLYNTYGRLYTTFEASRNDIGGVITYDDAWSSVSAGQTVSITTSFSQGALPLAGIDSAKYYVYMWAEWNGNFYPDELLVILEVDNGKLYYTTDPDEQDAPEPVCAHALSYALSADGKTITETCSLCTHNKTVSIAAAAQASGAAYTGASVTKETGFVGTVSAISYYQTTTAGAVTGGRLLASAPSQVGYYYAAITAGGKTAAASFSITPATYAVTLDPNSGTAGSVTSVTATQGEAMPPLTGTGELPTRATYTFAGYYDHPTNKDKQYYNADGTSARNWDLTSGATLYAHWTPVPTAAIGDVTVSGTTGSAIAPAETTVTLTNGSFKALAQDADVSSWFTNIPTGLDAKLKAAVPGNESAATITFSGIPTVERAAAMAVTIPAESLNSNAALTAAVNANARWEIVAPATYMVTLLLELDGSAYAGQTVVIQEGGGTVYTLSEGASGAYTNGAVPNGAYTIYVGGASTEQTVTVNGANKNATLDYFTLSFNANGGTPTPQSQILLNGRKGTQPAGVAKDTDILEGWYSDMELTAPWTFADDPVTATTMLYAKWTPVFVPVSNILRNFAASVMEATDLTLNGTVEPSDATNQVIKWSISPDDDGTTAAMIDPSGVFRASAAGTVTVRATVVNGLTASTDYTQDFAITVSPVPVTTYDIAVSANNAAWGNVSGSGTYDEGGSVTVSAAPGTGYRFVQWTEGGGGVSTDARYTFAATADRTLMAVFEADAYTLRVTRGTGGGSHVRGSSVTIVADAPAAGQRFKEWTISPDVTFTAGSKATSTATFTMPGQNTSAAATYEAIPATAVAFSSLTANGADTVSTTALTLTLDRDVAGFSIADITLTGASKGALTKESGAGVYALTLSGVTVPDNGTVNVAVAKSGFTFTPANRDVRVRNHAPIDPPASENSISGIAAGQSYTRGASVSFTATGGGMSNHAPKNGDMRYLPVSWQVNPSGNFESGFTQRFSTAAMTLGEHTLNVTFAKQRYNGAAWADIQPAVTDVKSVRFMLVAAAPSAGAGGSGSGAGYDAAQAALRIDPPESAPDREVTVIQGDAAELSVTVWGAEPISCQWYRSTDGGRSFAPLGGATGRSLATAPVQRTNYGERYYCVASNGASSVQSCTFILRVLEHVEVPATGGSFSGLCTGMLLMAEAILVLSALYCRKKRKGRETV